MCVVVITSEVRQQPLAALHRLGAQPSLHQSED